MDFELRLEQVQGFDLKTWFTGLSVLIDQQKLGRTWVLYNLNSSVIEIFLGYRL